MDTTKQQEMVDHLEMLLAQAKVGHITTLICSIATQDTEGEATDWTLIGNMGAQHALALLGQNKLIDQALIGFINDMEIDGFPI